MKNHRYALIWIDPNPLGGRTGYTVVSTHRTLEGATRAYQRNERPGYAIGHRIGTEYRVVRARL